MTPTPTPAARPGVPATRHRIAAVCAAALTSVLASALLLAPAGLGAASARADEQATAGPTKAGSTKADSAKTGSAKAGSAKTAAAKAADSPRTATGKNGQKLTVSHSAGLDPAGQKLRVTGEGYDTAKGIYVAFCKDNGDNRVPSPCLGGADMTGGSHSSRWIVPEGDPYEGELATAYGPGGTFDIEIEVTAQGDGLDCAKVTCAVVTRVDHRASGDRSQDVRIPVAFEGQDPQDPGGDGVDVPAGTVTYRPAGEFTSAGKPLDLLVHPDSEKLYVGSDNLADTADTDERGLYVLDPGDGKVRSHIAQAPGSTGTLRPSAAARIAAPLPGDGVAYHYPLRGIGTAKDGDQATRGVWLAGSTVTDVGPGFSGSTLLVAQGARLSEVETATGAVRREITLEGAGQFAADPRRGTVWWADFTAGRLHQIDGASAGAFHVAASAELPASDGLPGFVEVDPASGDVWVGRGNAVTVFGTDGKPKKTITGGADLAKDAAFDPASGGRAFVVWQDTGDLSIPGSDNDGALTVHDTATFEEATDPVPLPGNRAQSGSASVAVAPGGATVFVASPAEGKVVRLVRRMSPKVTRAPSDLSVRPGDRVTLTALAEGAPEPTVRWQVSPDGGQTWQTVGGATGTTYAFDARAEQDGYQYRAEFRNDAGTTRTSPVTLTVTAEDPGGPGGSGGSDSGSEPSGTRTVTGPDGQKLTVTPVNGLAVEDQKLTVTGSGYDEKKGIYVALCVDNGPGELPTPCIGGVDMTGGAHTSAWISSNPPDYGEELAIPYGAGGSFEVELTVDAKDEFTDCFKVKCVVATRADHTLSADRSQDVKVPVSFTGQPPVASDGDTGGGTAGSDSGGSTGGPGSGPGGAGGASGGSDGSSGTGSSGDGSLAATGVTVLTTAAAAAALLAAGWLAFRRGRSTK
ncbi:immunoglobulin I-set domain protein [Streptomyces pathocidini]|uniref:Immunoglobulin I-set domain protein n=1 Tax=Streptomyces pathocidini TaxID=1650571 RepID=A0ABW7UKH5_9ACTN|nr:immunoglobulin I-set domain protein [Streptomyces pathocidini]